MVNGEVSVSKLRKVDPQDLLGREPIKVNLEEIFDYIHGKTVMVTGGGGSIGSELCRQIARCNPRQLIILDNYENNAYEIQQELIRIHGDKLNLAVEIASVQDAQHLDYVFAKYRPEIVFHAAAHKHVPLMESAGYEAVKNNVLGTYNTANMAEKYGARKFVLISTDKAVNPTNVMGATKRLCEMVVQCRGDSQTNFCAVRFGNVLGSNGSVIPLFKKQIADGGPVTITDKRIVRYFMTIREASQLVIQAGAMAKCGELFVLDMGKPVKIYDLAESMIKLSGLVPEKDIPIVEIGLRPGEKLYEELLIRAEELDKTENNMIFIERDAPLSRQDMDQKIQKLRSAITAWDTGEGLQARQVLKEMVPSFCEPETLNRAAETAREMQAVL
jgi:FlaA1/EpsC-like NDP-sugar epimerase